jgi:hypothetical protein
MRGTEVTSNVNNRGIIHLAHKAGGFPACRNTRAHMSVTLEVFKTMGTDEVCKKCDSTALKWIAKRLGEAA